MIFGLPTASFWLLIGIPSIMLAFLLFECWRIWTGRKD